MIHTRREFLGSAAATVAAAGISQRAFGKKIERPLGVQLYTVRSLVGDDFAGTLSAIRKIGYTTVETYVAEYKMSAKDLRGAIENAGLKATSAHFGYNDFDSRIEYGKELGAELIVCAMVPLNIANSADGYKRGAEQYNVWGTKAKSMGMEFGFHNHNVEFNEFGGKTGLEILLENTDPATVCWQMDCYWVAQSGHDPVAMIRKYGNRIRSLHVKDRKPGAPVTLETGPKSAYFTEVGNGTLDWKDILRLTPNAPYLFVEQDQSDKPPLESLQISYTNLVKLMKSE
jgi:sugar phosphate isomerase/epimerase